MKKQYKIISTIFILVFLLSVLHYIFIVIPNFQVLLELDSQFWNDSSTLEKSKRLAYYFGYLFPFAISISWLLRNYFKPENRLKRVGFKKEIISLKNLLRLKTITNDEYAHKLLNTESVYMDLKEEIKKTNSAKRTSAQFQLEHKSLIELKERGLLDQGEFEHKMAKLKLEKNKHHYDLETIEVLVKKYDFKNQNMQNLLSEEFRPPMCERSSQELISVLKSDDYKISAKYQAYIEIMNRKRKSV